MSIILESKNISFSYYPGKIILNDISLTLEPGTFTGIFGPNGCGKSTLLNCLAGNLIPEKGSVLLAGEPLKKHKRKDIAQKITVVRQELPGELNFTVRELVAMGRFPFTDFTGACINDDIELVEHAIELMRIGHLAERDFSTLSGGEKRRTAIAKALAQNTDIYLLDEPGANLDFPGQIELYSIARDLALRGCAVAMICHDLFLAPAFVDNAILISNGQIVQRGSPAEVLNRTNLGDVFGREIELTWPSKDEMLQRKWINRL